MRKSFIKIDRKITEWRWYKNANTCRVFLHLLIKACFKDYYFENRLIKRGSLVTSVSRLGSELNLSDQEIKTALRHLKSTKEITVEGTAKYSIVIVNNYDEYQNANNIVTNNQPTVNQQLTNIQPTANQQITNNQPQYKNVKKEKNENNEKNEREVALAFGNYNNVFLLESDFQKLKTQYPDRYLDKINRLSCYMETSGKVYHNHYAKIVEWLEEDAETDLVVSKKVNRIASYDIEELEKIL